MPTHMLSNLTLSALSLVADTKAAAPSPAAAPARTIQSLFAESFDAFSVVLLLASVVAGAVIIRCVFEIRRSTVLPEESEKTIRQYIASNERDRLSEFVRRDQAFVSIVVRAALDAKLRGLDNNAAREAAELAASEQSSAWFHQLEPLNVIGNLGPLLGLAGTIWGMILAFSAISDSGGQASPTMLSSGIAKALFHTLLGLLLAIPSLTVFGFYRQRTDRLCTRALVISAELTDLALAQSAPTSTTNK